MKANDDHFSCPMRGAVHYSDCSEPEMLARGMAQVRARHCCVGSSGHLVLDYRRAYNKAPPKTAPMAIALGGRHHMLGASWHWQVDRHITNA